MAKAARSVLDGISFENRKLEEVIKEQEEKDRITAIEQERRKEQSRGARFTGIPWGRKIKSTYRGRSSKARRWDAHKIRREYGLMKKKFESQWENCLWVVAFEPPVTARKVFEVVGGTMGGVTGAMSYLQQFLGEGNDYGTAFIKSTDHGRGQAKTYEPIEGLVTDEARTSWFEKAREAYMTARTTYNRARAKIRKEAKEKDHDNVFANDLHETQEIETSETEKPTASTTEATAEASEKPVHAEHDAKEQAIVEERMNRDEQAEALERVIGEFVVAKLKSLDLLKTAELKLTVSGGIKIEVKFGFGE